MTKLKKKSEPDGDLREQIVGEVENYFAGPRKTDESFADDPLDYYIAGILLPKDAKVEKKDDDQFGTPGKTGPEDTTSPDQIRQMIKQNSIGLRVNLKEDVKEVGLEVGYARYTHEDVKWKRHALENKKRDHRIDLTKDYGKIEIKDGNGDVESEITWNLKKTGKDSKGFTVLNIFLANPKTWQKPDDKKTWKMANQENNGNCIFQPALTVKSLSGSCPFRNVPPDSTGSMDDYGAVKRGEELMLDLLFRESGTFGAGYGCAAEWDLDKDPLAVKTSTVPTYMAKQIDTFSDGSDDKPSRIDMYALAGLDKNKKTMINDTDFNRNAIKSNLAPLIKKYGEWIEHNKGELPGIERDFGEEYRRAAEANLKNCDAARERIQDGLDLLTKENGPDAEKIVKAFVFANRAMLQQRLRYDYALKRSKGQSSKSEEPSMSPGKEYWYPFQIAFILMSLRGIAFPHHKNGERNNADLLWFPTGGGKTEAYMGVAAFTILLRRLRGDGYEGIGTSVFMRYTLRLLTLQQFERASTLVCALENMRTGDPRNGLGDKPFLIGLWVGYSLTPNDWTASAEALQALRKKHDAPTPNGSPWQTFFCPWCGEKIEPENYFCSYSKSTTENHWTILHCGNRKCYFHGSGDDTTRALPLVMVDSDIYSRGPSIIIGTVDKLARMPFRKEIATIFGRAEKYCEQHGFLSFNEDHPSSHPKINKKVKRIDSSKARPDLIIQDELHLIDGPLGTMVGLYETAVDYLSSSKNSEGDETRPKILVSTATVRGAEDQVRRIFNRKQTKTFPPPGINRNDSFFWWESDRPGRQYVGVSFSNRSAKFAIARLYASLLQKVKQLSLTLDTKMDPYWTLVGYFNSIRELGGSIRLVEDDVKSDILFLTESVEGMQCPPHQRRKLGTMQDGVEELTGRKKQKDLNIIREKLLKPMNDPAVLSVLLATNMISVGIDVDRMGLMAVNGQPKNTTEYIQATGRIGRRKDVPGLVFTMLNPWKPRDLSHYENFVGYHMTMQKSVEPASVTPFSISACERGLHAVYIAMIRLSIANLSDKKDANNIGIYAADVSEIQEAILKRFREVQQVNENDLGYKDFKNELINFHENWERFVEDTDKSDDGRKDGVWYNNPYRPPLWGGTKKDNKNVLMIEFSKKLRLTDGKFPKATPESLRDVEQMITMEYV